MKYFIEGIAVESFGLDEFTEQDAKKYVDYIHEHVPPEEMATVGKEVTLSIEVKLCDDGKVDADYIVKGENFERIRRITGKRIAVCSQAG